ncbi:hypothetical protein ATO6_19850 [Oceanicola sp. 22II-s10i]|uniref:acetate--CoA ligase family protein n=1 Tax=Oceanicola sp. 22II-s10i TaxID=1317116 RepID=UPI000B5202A0|nr:acetate--CoA ligase family protein [Oceanicola sp. 22II-s10i]OWU83119.1 hypothetical protein ATO6_19850 [Oceanicola sp. 22II-s10i]
MLDDGKPLSGLDAVFRPRSVAVIGASDTETKIGGTPLSYLRTLGYTGRIIPINPKAPEIQGLPAYPNIKDAPGPVDLAIIAVPASLAVQALQDCADAGVKGVVMFSSGFAEVSEEGAANQARMHEIARASGLRLMGPNCLGFMNIEERVFATFAPVVGAGVAPKGRIGLVSQSGAFGGFAFSVARERGIGLSYWITTGNEADLGFSESVEWLASDPGTDVIVGYMEGCRDGDGLRRALDACRRAGKPLIVCKVGKTEAGAKAAASHTAALAGEDAVFDGVFRQYNVVRADSIEECLDIAYAASIAGLPKGPRVGLYTVSGGAGVLMADMAEARGLTVPEFSRETQDKVLAMVPFAGTRNPLDITGQVSQIPGASRTALGLMAADGACDTIVSFISAAGLGPAGMEMAGDIAHVRAARPEVMQVVATLPSPAFRKAVEAAGVPVFEDPNRAVNAVAALARIARGFAASGDGTGDTPAPLTVPADCTEPLALAALGERGLPVVDFRHVRTAAEAGQAAEEIGGPVVVKIVSPDIGHKSDIGGVELNLTGRAAVEAAGDRILTAARTKAPGARLDGLMVAPMRRGVAECVIGVQRDPTFGPVVMFGLGGVHVEALRDVVFRAAPFGEAEAKAMIHQVRAIRLLTHPRGSDPADIDALASLLAQVSRIAAASPGLESADMNPVLALTDGAVILDALLIG